jgi:hypothetical protein
VERRPFLWAQGAEYTVFDSGEALLGGLEFGDPDLGDRNDVSATVIGVVLADDHAASLEVIEQADEVARIQPKGLGKSGLGGGAVIAQQREQHQVSGSQVIRQGALTLTLADAREMSKKRQRRRGVDLRVRRCHRLSL